MTFDNWDLMQRSIRGDAVAARMYCGSYTLIRDINGKSFRCKGDIPEGYTEVKGVYDKDGFLHMQYWSLPRI